MNFSSQIAHLRAFTLVDEILRFLGPSRNKRCEMLDGTQSVKMSYVSPDRRVVGLAETNHVRLYLVTSLTIGLRSDLSDFGNFGTKRGAQLDRF